MQEKLYFAYGSNMSLGQMEYRCPQASVVENVWVDGYRLAFCSQNPESGVATILPEEGSHVNGVLWKITAECEKALDRYEGYPRLYGKEVVHVKNADGKEREVMVYTMNEPYKDSPSRPADFYLKGILDGCRENGLPVKPVIDAVKRTREELTAGTKNRKNSHKDWSR